MAKTYYVSAENGNDKNAGNEKKPLKTIQAGINKLSAGDTLLVRKGTYDEQIIVNRSGDKRNPIAIQAYPGEKPVIDGERVKLSLTARLVQISRSQNLQFNGFEVRNSRGRGIGLNDCTSVVVSGCDIHNCQSNGILIIDCQETTIEKNKVHACAQKYVSAAADAQTVALFIVRSQNVVAQDNTCYENSAGGIAAYYARSVAVRKNTCYDNRAFQIQFSSTTDSAIEANFCYHTGRQAFLHLDGGRPPGIVKGDRKGYPESGVWHTRSVVVANNIIVGCRSGFEVPAYGGILTAVGVIHNTIVNSTGTAIQIEAGGNHRDTVLENNLVATTSSTGGMSGVASPNGLLWRNNFWSRFPSDQTFNPANDVVNASTGLRDINAPVVAGQTITAPYELTAVSPAVNSGATSDVGIDFYGRVRDRKPDIGAHEFDNSNGPDPGDGNLPPAGERVKNGLLALYDFSAGWGNTIADVSGVGAALDLTIENTTTVQWSTQGLIVKSPTTIGSGGPATKVIEACRTTNEIAVEAWITPATADQGGPARIVSISLDANSRNVTLGQGLKNGEPTKLYNTRLRTTNSDDNGIPSVSTPNGSLLTASTHVVFTRNKDGHATIYMNGQERAIDTLPGSLSNWANNYRLWLANERTGDRPWLGTYTLVALFSRVLTAAEVQHNYEAGLPKVEPLVAEFRVAAGQEIGLAPHTADFDSSDSYAHGGIATYAWDFGDGAHSAEANPSHIYSATGVYTVSLTITDTKGLTSSVTKTNFITVTDTSLPSLPIDYARFVLANVVESRILAFGIQYPDFRCVLTWNQDPHQIMLFRTLEDVLQIYRVPGIVEQIWIDYPASDVIE